MGLAGLSLGRELRALALTEPHRFGAAWHRLSENSVTNSRADCALTQHWQMIGCIKG